MSRQRRTSLRRLCFGITICAGTLTAASSAANEVRDISDSSTVQIDGVEFYFEEPWGEHQVAPSPDYSVADPNWQDPYAVPEEWLAPDASMSPWTWQILPRDLIFPSYLAGYKEPRLGTVVYYERDAGWLWEATVGGRIGIARLGTPDDSRTRPEGWQWDVEGAAFPRLDLENDVDLVSSDFRAGTVVTRGFGSWQTKLGYYHLSSHLGDEFMLDNPGADRNNYSRDALVAAVSCFPWDALRIYAEVGWAFNCQSPSEPWEFQVGLDYAPGVGSGPFLAINGHLRDEVDFGGNLVVQTGWQWRSRVSGPMLRYGLHFFHGNSNQFEFFDQFEEQIGVGIWYDY
jgi:hypothetical protein